MIRESWKGLNRQGEIGVQQSPCPWWTQLMLGLGLGQDDGEESLQRKERLWGLKVCKQLMPTAKKEPLPAPSGHNTVSPGHGAAQGTG